MKKTKKAILILSAVMVILSCVVSPIYADEAATEPMAVQQQQEEKITDPEKICEMIRNYLDQRDVYACVKVDESMYFEDADGNIHYIVNVYTSSKYKTLIQKSVNAFIKENNIDENMVAIGSNLMGYWVVIFGDANYDGVLNIRDCAEIASKISSGKANDLLTSSDYNRDGKRDIRDAADIAQKLSKDKITNINEITTFISEYVKNNDLPAKVHNSGNHVTVEYDWTIAKISEYDLMGYVKNFMNEKNVNINDGLVEFIIAE